MKLRTVAVLVLLCFRSASAGSVQIDLKAEHDPVRRSERAMTIAEETFDEARQSYDHGAIQRGDAQLEQMTLALNECVASLKEAHKSRFYKKPELRVSLLQRRLQTLLEDLGVEQRGWAEYTARKLNEIHDKLLAGALGK